VKKKNEKRKWSAKGDEQTKFRAAVALRSKYAQTVDGKSRTLGALVAENKPHGHLNAAWPREGDW